MLFKINCLCYKKSETYSVGDNPLHNERMPSFFVIFMKASYKIFKKWKLAEKI